MINMLLKSDKMGGFLCLFSPEAFQAISFLLTPTKIILFVIMFVCDHDNLSLPSNLKIGWDRLAHNKIV